MGLLLFFLSTGAFAESNCTNDLTKALELLGPDHKISTWIETTANDHKPLFIQLAEKNKKVFLTFFKTKEGVWAEGTATVCDKDGKGKLLAKIAKQDIILGQKIPVFIKWGFNGGGNFTLKRLKNKTLDISTFGWGGKFVPSTDQALAAAKKEVL